MIMFTDTITDKQAPRQRSKLGIIALLLVLALVISSGMAFAAGIEGKGKGVRNSGMGAGGIGMSDDWSSIYHNPAGVAFLSGHAFYIGVTWSPLQQEWTRPDPYPEGFSNFKSGAEAKGWEGEVASFSSYPNLPPEPAYFSENEVNIPRMITPELGWYRNFGRYTIGIAMYGAAGTGTKYNDKLPLFDYHASTGWRPLGDTQVNVEMAQFSVAIPISMGMRITDNFAIGFNFSLLYARDENTSYKAINSFPGVPVDPAIPGGDTYQSFEFNMEYYKNGMGFAPELGVMYKPFDTLSIGGLVRFPHTVTFTGETRVWMSDMQSRFTQMSDTEGSKYVPWKAGMGLCWKPKQNLTFLCDLYWVQHSKYKWRTRYLEGPPLFTFFSAWRMDDTTEFWHMKDTLQVAVGAEYVYKEKYAFRCGMYTDPTSTKSESVSLATARNGDVYAPTVGFGYYSGKNRYDMAFIYGFDKKRTVIRNDPNGVPLEESIQGTSYFFCVGYTRQFRE